jgi:hypothetical protein
VVAVGVVGELDAGMTLKPVAPIGWKPFTGWPSMVTLASLGVTLAKLVS